MLQTPEPRRCNDQAASDPVLSSTRLALVAGFGSLLVIMALAGLDALRVLQDVRENDDRIRRQFLFQNHVLNEIRSEVYLSGTYVRDYLLEPDTERADRYRTSLEQLRQQMESALDSYRPPARARAGEALFRAPSGAGGVLADPGSDLPMGSRGTPAARAMLFCATRCFRAGRTCWRSPIGLPTINEQQFNAGNDQVVGLL